MGSSKNVNNPKQTPKNEFSHPWDTLKGQVLERVTPNIMGLKTKIYV